jgi:hypothetical protein
MTKRGRQERSKQRRQGSRKIRKSRERGRGRKKGTEKKNWWEGERQNVGKKDRSCVTQLKVK